MGLNRTIRMAAAMAIGWGCVACVATRSGPPDHRPQADAPDEVSPSDLTLTIYSTADPGTFDPQDLLQQELSRSYNSMTGALFSPPFVAAPGYGVVRDVRKLQLVTGKNRLEFTEVAAGIDPTTVAFRSLTAPRTTAVLEQNFEFDLANPDKLLQKFIGRDVVVTLKQPAGGNAELIRGKMLSATGNAYVIQTNDAATPLIVQRIDNIDSVRLAQIKTGLVTKPTLNWIVDTDHPGMHDVQVSYETEGLTWRADYTIVLDKEETSADLSAWVTALNASGLSYPNARIKLIAGNINRPESKYSQQQRSGLFGGEPAPREAEGFREQSFFEYHLYTLGRRTRLPNNSTKQIELFPPKFAVPIKKTYMYYGFPEGDHPPSDRNGTVTPNLDAAYGTNSSKTVAVYVGIKNGKAEHLGLPLPAGRIHMYKVDPNDGNKEFIGEDVIEHTPVDEEILLRLGNAFDIVGERTQTAFTIQDKTVTESFEIKIRNHKKEPVRVVARENLYRWPTWQITESSEKWVRQEGQAIHIAVDVAADAEKKLMYTVKYTMP